MHPEADTDSADESRAASAPATRSITDIMLEQAKLLIVDDEKANVRLLEIILQQAGYRNIYSTTDSRQALPLIAGIKPDLLLLDLAMPHYDGFAIMQKLQKEIPDSTCPILVLTADARPAAKHRALNEGASDFLTKPLDDVEVLLRIRNLLSAHFHNVLLEETVRERTQDLEAAQLETLQRLALAAEYRDDATGLHTKRVGIMSGRIARVLGLEPAQVDLIELAAPLHDVGKIAVPDSILLKPGKLTVEEFAQVKQHTVIGARILSGSGSPLLKMAEEVAMYHHEHWNGRGYLGLTGESIPLSGRIVCVADVFDALTHERPYKEAWTVEAALAELRSQSGLQFDASVVEALLEVIVTYGESVQQGVSLDRKRDE
jgi:putative two-component system response regulator